MPEVRKKQFTDRWLRSLKPLKSSDTEYRKAWWDTGMPGLCVRPGERVTFYAGKRPKRSAKFVWVKLGDYPALPLYEARSKAALVVTSLADGKPVPSAAQQAMTFAMAAEQFIQECLEGKRTRVEIEQLIRRKMLPTLGTKALAAVTHDDIVTLLREIADQPERHASGRIISGGPHAARKTLVHLRVMLRWCAFNRIGGLMADPSASIPARELLRGRHFNRQRDRVLDDAELRLVWQAAEQTPYPFGPLVQLLLATGQRLNEVAAARWDEIDGATLLIPASRMKNKQAHAVPLTGRLQALLATLPRFADGGYIFSTTYGTKPISGFSKYKKRFDRTITGIGHVAPFQLHDIRRSVRTGLSRAGVVPFYAELVIGHVQDGIHRVYDLHRYASEKRDALESWERLLEQILTDETGTVEERVAAGGY
jgi:integrase